MIVLNYDGSPLGEDATAEVLNESGARRNLGTGFIHTNRKGEFHA
jgi:hypothetical protein